MHCGSVVRYVHCLEWFLCGRWGVQGVDAVFLSVVVLKANCCRGVSDVWDYQLCFAR